MSKKYLTLLTGILISGCNSNGTASKVSPQLPQVIKSVASSVNKAKVGAILGTYVCTFHNHKTGNYDGQIPTFIDVYGEFKKLQNIPFTGKALDVTLFMPSEAPDYNKIIKKCEDLNLDPDDVIGDVIDGVKISTNLKSSFLYDIYNPNLAVGDNGKFLEGLNKRSNDVLKSSINYSVKSMRKVTFNDYMSNNFLSDSPAFILVKPNSPNKPNERILHTGKTSDGSFRSDVFNLNSMPKRMYDIKNQIHSYLYFIDSEDGYSSVQNPDTYKRYLFTREMLDMITEFIASYDWKGGFMFAIDNLTTSKLMDSNNIQQMNWIKNKTTYRILSDNSNPKVAHIYVTRKVSPVFNYTNALQIEPDLSYASTIDFVLNLAGYKSSGAIDNLGMQEVLISKTLPMKGTVIEAGEVSSLTKDFMQQMIFNAYQGKGGLDYFVGYGVKNNDTWSIK